MSYHYKSYEKKFRCKGQSEWEGYFLLGVHAITAKKVTLTVTTRKIGQEIEVI